MQDSWQSLRTILILFGGGDGEVGDFGEKLPYLGLQKQPQIKILTPPEGGPMLGGDFGNIVQVNIGEVCPNCFILDPSIAQKSGC